MNYSKDLLYRTGYERVKANNLTSHTISRASGILILSLLPRTTVPVDDNNCIIFESDATIALKRNYLTIS